MGTQLAAVKAALKVLAEACGTEPPKNVLGDPTSAATPSGSPKAPSRVAQSGGGLLLDINTLLGSSDAHGTTVRVTYVPTGTHEDVATTWAAGEGDPDNTYGTGLNQAATGLLGQAAPGSTIAADYQVDTFGAHGSAWELDGGGYDPGGSGEPKSPFLLLINALAGKLVEEVVIAKLNELVGQYNQLRSDYNSSTRPTSATAVAEIST